MSVADGGYLVFQAGLRKHENARGKDIFTGGYGEYNGLKSSFLNVQFSRAIPAGLNKTVTYQWEYNNDLGSFTDDLKIEGYMLEIAYKLPLNLLSVNK